MITWRLTELHKSFRIGRWPLRRIHRAVNGASLAIEAGERLGLVGPSGSGKSTLIRCGLGLIPIDRGSIQLFGEDTARWSRGRWRRTRRRAQILFQDPRAMLHADVPIGALLADSAALHQPEAPPRRVAAAAPEEVGLGDRFGALPHERSGGEQRRVGLARVMLARPQLLVADEPTSGLDAAVKASMVALLLERVGPSCSVVLVSHDLSTLAKVCDRVVVIDGGQVVERLVTSALETQGWRPSHPCTAALLEAAGWTPPERTGP